MDVVGRPASIGLGVVLLVVAGVLCVARASFVSSAARAQGTIVGVDRSLQGDEPSYRKVFAFRDGSGQEYRVISRVGTNVRLWTWDTGDSVTVLYHPTNPKESAVVDSFLDLWLMPVGFAIVGLSVTGAGLLGRWRRR